MEQLALRFKGFYLVILVTQIKRKASRYGNGGKGKKNRFNQKKWESLKECHEKKRNIRRH